MSIRTITYLLNAAGVSPEFPQYGGVRYEDNATNVVFALDNDYKQNIKNAYPGTELIYRIDFNSLNSGYNPSENLVPTDNKVSRTIPLCMTFYGEQISAVLVITAIDGDKNAVGTVVSPEVKIYFDNISKDEPTDSVIEANISAAEERVKELCAVAEKQAELAEDFADIAADNAASLQAAADSAADSAAIAEENAKISEKAAAKCSSAKSILEECEAATEKIENIKDAIDDDGFFRSIEETNKGLVMQFWVGTRAEYDALTKKPQDCYVIITDDNTLTDFIVEQGKTDGWTYRKWNSGIMECWRSASFSVDVATVYDSVRYHSAAISKEIPSGWFVEVPLITASPRFGVTSFELIRRQWNYPTGTNTGDFFIATRNAVHTTDENYQPFLISFDVKGRWK